MKKIGRVLILAGFLVLILSIFIKLLFPAGVKADLLILKFSFHDISKAVNFSIDLLFAGFLFTYVSSHSYPDWKLLSLVFFGLTAFLKVLRYEFFLAPGYDLGNYASILHNIIRHGRLFDSLNGVHAFSGHVRPFLIPLSTVFLIKESPITLLVLQTAGVSLTIPIILKVGRLYSLDGKSVRYLMAIFISNMYLHHVNGFDFHLEAFAIPLILLGIYFLERRTLTSALIVILVTLTFKEDVAITWFSVGLYYLLVRKEFRIGIIVTVISAIYGMFAAYLITRYVDFQTMQEAHYSSFPGIGSILSSSIRFFASFGFLPLLDPGSVIAWTLPFLEHITSSRPHHYNIFYQYSANLLPVVIWGTALALRRDFKFKDKLVALAILFSVFHNPLSLYIDVSKVDFSRRNCLKKILSEIPEGARVSCGNHISPHLATRDGVFQFPLIDSVDYVIVDTSWHDFTPVDEDSAWKIINSLKMRYKTESRCGVLILKRRD